jgi:hypothetical protein
MTTAAQIEASRRNGAISRGPITAEGKRRSAENSTRHGLTARRITIPGEDLEEWMALCDSYFDVWQPVGLVEVDLVEAIASYAWRLRRAPGAEASAIRRAMAHRRDGAEKDGTEPMSSDGAEPDDLGDVFMDLDAHGFLSRASPATKPACLAGEMQRSNSFGRFRSGGRCRTRSA